MHLKYCTDCGQPIGFTLEKKRWNIGDKVKVMRNAQKKNEQAGIPWTPEMNWLKWRRGTVKEIIMGAIVVEFEDRFSPARKHPIVTGAFQFHPDALEACRESHDKFSTANKRNSKKVAYSKAWHASWMKGMSDRERGLHLNPFEPYKIEKIVHLWKNRVPYKEAKKILHETPGLSQTWKLIRRLELNNGTNQWIAGLLHKAYEQAWKQTDEKLMYQFFTEALVELLRENSLRLDSHLLREIEAKNIHAFRGISDKLLTKYGYD